MGKLRDGLLANLTAVHQLVQDFARCEIRSSCFHSQLGQDVGQEIAQRVRFFIGKRQLHSKLNDGSGPHPSDFAKMVRNAYRRPWENSAILWPGPSGCFDIRVNHAIVRHP